MAAGLVLAGSLGTGVVLQAQQPSNPAIEDWKPEKLVNVEILPKTMAPDEVIKLMKSYNAALNVDYIGYPVPTKAGMAEYNKLIKGYPWLAIGDDDLSDPSQWMTSLTGSQLALWTSTWTKVKAA